MNSNYFQLLFNDMKKLWKGLNVPQRFGLIVLLLATVVLSTIFIFKSFEPDLTVLYSDLAESDVVTITENLKKNGYSFKLTDDKKTILVPASQKDAMRLYVAENDLIQNSNPGFELLDNMQLGSTDFKNNLTKQRIFQGELTRSIEKMEGVKSVRVQLAQPERSIFEDKDEIPSASVMLILDAGYKLKASQVKAIKNLVAYSIPRLTTEKVFITDQFGNSLSDETSKNSNDMESFKSGVEKDTAKKITSVLEEIVGRGNVSVQVNADIDFNSAKATIERYIPLDEKGEGVLTSTQSEIENYENPNNNQAQPQPQNPNAGVPNKNLNYAKEKSSTSYSVSKEVKHIVYAPGTIKRLTIAVAVNKILTKPEKDELQNLVLSAAGVDYDRGDVITVSGLQFEALSDDKKRQEALAKKNAQDTLFEYFAVKLGPSIVVLVLGLFAITLLKNLVSRLPHYDVKQNILDEPDDEDLGLDPTEEEDLSVADKIDKLGGLMDGYPSVDFDRDDTQATLQDIEISRQEQSINTLNEAILADPEAAAKVLMSYIKE